MEGPDDIKAVRQFCQALERRRPDFGARDIHEHASYLMGICIATEILLREICRAAKVTVERQRQSMGGMVAALTQARLLPHRLEAHLSSLVPMRNMVVHGMVEPGVEDTNVVENQAKILFKWYLVEFPHGPKLSDRDAIQLMNPPHSEERHPRRRVFLCYAKEDQARAEDLYELIKKNGHQPWMDKKDLLPGQEWEQEIELAIRNSDLFVACLSKASVSKRGFVQKEVRFALDVLGQIPPGQIFLIPVRLERCDVPAPLSSLHWVDLDVPGGVESLLKAIHTKGK